MIYSIEKDRIFTLDSGEFDDFGVDVFARALEDLDLFALGEAYVDAVAAGEAPAPGMTPNIGFAAWLEAQGKIERLSVDRHHTGRTGTFILAPGRDLEMATRKGERAKADAEYPYAEHEGLHGD
ncbi:hypothetical protein [Thioalkalivibrio sp. ALE16]|uniref:hypothetical protein n=1 Tax=Thioalkalivibrio sp. ALE16 TaxID=1158172 RepID=UPI00037504BA|nr:hypothetical protein [Thioalkalivibrio sp. ALE16]